MPVLLGLLVVLSVLWVPAAEAREELEVRVSAAGVWTDNVSIEPDGQGLRERDFVLTVEPGLRFTTDRPRLSASVDYSAEYLRFLDAGVDDVRHRLFGVLNAEPIKRRLFLRGRASVQQTFLNQRDSLSGNSANISDNRRLVQNYSGTARVRGRLTNLMDWTASYRFGATLSPADNLDDDTITQRFSDTFSNQASLRLESGERFGHLGFALDGQFEKVYRSLDVTDFRRSRAVGEVSLELSRMVKLFAVAGVSDNNLDRTTLSEDGFAWEGGVRLTPGRKLSLELFRGAEGDRTTWRGNLRYTLSSRLTLNGEVSDGVASNTGVILDRLDGLSSNLSDGVLGTDGEPVRNSQPNFTLSDVDFRRRTINGSLTWRDRRNRVSLSADTERRTFDNETGTAKSWGVGARYSRELDRQTRFSASGNYRRNAFEGSDRVDETLLASLSLEKRVYENIRMSLSYDFSQRFSNTPGGDLLENAVRFQMTALF
ncbi:TIGR03016 family PEP-CTERM system-associated outer membrane protein [Yunchengibacter salinarum]|uniref:TIGR03016 family PEP-CTERM system-associated outer membrane protein n=1 Tax=Yunchengibacter salinarum TaxID=3133399 RepID=UPI0035B5B1A7